MTDRPIIFSGPMVRALLDGRKTQTRRVLKLPNAPNHLGQWEESTTGGTDRFGVDHPEGVCIWHTRTGAIVTPSYAIGDRLDPSSEIEGYPDYCVGISGNVYSRKSGQWGKLQRTPNNKGYQRITLCRDGKRRGAAVHQLVCEAFHGPKPSPAHQVRHIDGNQENNGADNLCWGTQKENWTDRKAHGNGVEGEKHHDAILADAEREHLKWGFEKGLFSQRHAARILSMSQSAVQSVCTDGAPEPTIQDAPDHSHFRLTLTVTDVRVQRVQEIDGYDAAWEGLQNSEGHPAGHPSYTIDDFRRLWDSLNAKRGFGWDADPWVVALTFTVEERNIDDHQPR